MTASFVLLVLSTLCSIALPTMMTNVVDKGVSGGDFAYVVKTCAWMTAITMADSALIVVAYKISNRARFFSGQTATYFGRGDVGRGHANGIARAKSHG